MKNPMEDVYTAFKRITALVLGFLLLGISIWFSAEGLNFNLKDSLPFGIVIALAVTVFELIFDEDGFHGSITLAGLGVFAYAYGIISNYYGIWVRQGQPSDGLSIVFASILAIFIEVAPEQLILWALGLSGRGIRDMLSNFANMSKNITPNFNPKNSRPPGDWQSVSNGQSFNPAKRHEERIREERLKNQNQSQGKKKGKWKPGMPGRPPKNQMPPGLEKLLDVEVREE